MHVMDEGHRPTERGRLDQGEAELLVQTDRLVVRRRREEADGGAGQVLRVQLRKWVVRTVI